VRGEPVRGGLPDPGFYSLPGLDQVNALRRGLIPRPPLSHLTGLTVTEAGPGTATLTLPASPWFDSGEGMMIQVLAEAALSTAVLAGAPPAMDVRTAALSLTQFRSATLDADKLIAHGRTIRKAPTFTYAEAAIQDDLGREIARVTGAVVVRAKEPPPPPALPLGPPQDTPAYATPDPYRRPLPSEVAPVTQEQWERLDGLTISRLLATGTPLLPVFALFGAQGVSADPGRAVLTMTTSDWLCHRSREVAPGALATLAYDALVGAIMTVAGPATRLGFVNLNVSFFRPVMPDGRELVAEAIVTEHQGESVIASVTISDADGEVVASGYNTSVLLSRRGRPPARLESVLATVVFTDLVASTARATELGDEQWRQLLRDHEALVRRNLASFRGREIKTTGDGFLATFDSPDRAVQCARAIRDATLSLGMDVRVGIHAGQCEFAAGDITGIAVHLASRVLHAAAPGEVLVSSTVRDLLLGSGLGFEDRGRHELKGIEGDWVLFALKG
jgi:class 3 adenylate cyclase